MYTHYARSTALALILAVPPLLGLLYIRETGSKSPLSLKRSETRSERILLSLSLRSPSTLRKLLEPVVRTARWWASSIIL